MKFIENHPNKHQQRYAKMIQKVASDMVPNSLGLRVPDTSELEYQYEQELATAPNNFERKKIALEFERKKNLVWPKLGQVQFEITAAGFEYPLYFEVIPFSHAGGTILEGTLNIVVNRSVVPTFFGRIFNSNRDCFTYFATRGLGLEPDLFQDAFNTVKYRNGEFSLGQLISALKFRLGPNFIEMEAFATDKEPFESALLASIIKDREVMTHLIDLHYCSNRQFKPVDLPKSTLRFGFIETECVGCILPTLEDNVIVQFGDFNVITKSPLFPLLKRVVSILSNPAPP